MNIFIPRILPEISKTYIKYMFESMDYGNIVYIDMRKRINTKNKTYYFAFIKLEMTNDQYTKMVQLLETENKNRLYYNYPDYWELKTYIPYEDRDVKTDDIVKLCKELMKKPGDESSDAIYPTAFTKEDLCNINNEYSEIEQEISSIMRFENDILHSLTK